MEISQPDFGAQEVIVAPEIATDVDDTVQASSELEELAFPQRSPSPQIGLPVTEPNGPISHHLNTEQAQQHNEDMEQLPALIALPESPVSSLHGRIGESTIVGEQQPPRTITPVLLFEDMQDAPSDQFTSSPTPAQQKEEGDIPGSVEKTTAGLDLEDVDKLTTTQIHPEVLDRSPSGLVGSEIARTEIEIRSPDDLPNTPAHESAPLETPKIPADETTLQGSATSKPKDIVENRTPQHESTPMQASLSEGSKKKSKKARQREAKRREAEKRRSLQGIDTSGHSTIAAEMVRTPSIVEESVNETGGLSVHKEGISGVEPAEETRSGKHVEGNKSINNESTQ